MRQLYDFDLMLGSGHLTGYAVEDKRQQAEALAALDKLGDPTDIRISATALPAHTAPMVYAMGDGNHSLATAKAIWEQIKADAGGVDAAGADHPARYALVEIENIHDEGLAFEPIFRVLFDVKEDLKAALDRFYPDRYKLVQAASWDAMATLVDEDKPGGPHAIGVIGPEGCHVLYVSRAAVQSAGRHAAGVSGRLGQRRSHGRKRIRQDRLRARQGRDRAPGVPTGEPRASIFPPSTRHSFFKTVILDGALPRKTFSMGEAKEKRFYMEARRIV